MADRPIIFSAPMVRALLDGRKVQTRRVLKPQPPLCDLASEMQEDFELRGWQCIPVGERFAVVKRLPYAIGDRLWVREAVRADEHPEEEIIGVRYLADDHFEALPSTDEAEERHFILRCYRSTDPDLDAFKPVPPIHMPRWASRLTLTVTGVRVQRLQEISEADARAEGVECDSDGWRDYLMPSTQCCSSPRDSFHSLWNSLHGPAAWDANPWVAAISFTVERRNIDAKEGQTR